MTASEIRTARQLLDLSAADLGRALELEGRDPGRTVRAWETGATPIPGPARVAVRLMLEAHARQTVREAVQQAEAILAPAGGLAALQAPESGPVALKTRRRG